MDDAVFWEYCPSFSSAFALERRLATIDFSQLLGGKVDWLSNGVIKSQASLASVRSRSTEGRLDHASPICNQ
jgi:hypothetical protein